MIDQLLAQIQVLVQQAYAQGKADGMSAAAAPLLALEGTLSSELAAAQAQVQALLNPPAPPSA